VTEIGEAGSEVVVTVSKKVLPEMTLPVLLLVVSIPTRAYVIVLL